MTQVFIFNNASRAAGYGIGTYVRQLAEALTHMEGYEVSLIEMWADIKDFEVDRDTTGIRRYRIPRLSSGSEDEVYFRSVYYYLVRHMEIDGGDRVAFHFNYYHHLPIALLLKGAFPNSRILLSVHYFNWCFELRGNVTQFRETVKPWKDILDRLEFIPDEKKATVQKGFGQEQEFLFLADEVIVLSDRTMEIVREDYGVTTDKIHLIYNGLEDLPTYDGRVSGEYARQVIFVGRLDEIKGLDYLIEAFAKTADSHPDTVLTVAGDGNFQPYMKLARKIPGRVSFMGKMDPEELESLYQSAYIGVIPSFHEQCSYTAVEMMRNGIPFIGTDSTGLGEMLDIVPELRVHIDEENFDRGAFTDEIASRLDLLLGDREFRNTASERFRIQYKERHRAACMTERYRDHLTAAFRRDCFLSQDYLGHLDFAIMRLIDRRPDIDTEFFGMSGIGAYLWMRAGQLKSKDRDKRTFATVMEYLVYYMDWLEETESTEGLPPEMISTLFDMERRGFCRPSVRRILGGRYHPAGRPSIPDSNETIINALRICSCKI